MQRSKDSISQKVELCETAFIHAIPFSTMGWREMAETGKDGEKKRRKRSLIKHPYAGVKIGLIDLKVQMLISVVTLKNGVCFLGYSVK